MIESISLPGAISLKSPDWLAKSVLAVTFARRIIRGDHRAVTELSPGTGTPVIGGPIGVTLRLLGAVGVGDGQGNGFPDLEGRQKRIAVLAYLGAALPYGFHRRDKLFGQFWADMSQGNARRAL